MSRCILAGWRVQNWISSLVGSSPSILHPPPPPPPPCGSGAGVYIQTMGTTWQAEAAREKINFLPNNRSSRRRRRSHRVGSGGGWFVGCCAKILFRNEMKISSAAHWERRKNESMCKKALETNAARN